MASTSDGDCRPNAASTAAFTASWSRTRSRFSAHSGRSSPNAGAIRCHSASLPTAIWTNPSAARYRPYGQIDGW